MMSPDFEKAQTGHPHGISQALGLLIPPLAVLIDLQISYSIVHPVCEGNERWALFLPSAGAAAAIGLMLLLSGRRLRKERAREEVTSAERGKFVAAISVAFALFSLMVVAGFVVAKVVLSPCDR